MTKAYPDELPELRVHRKGDEISSAQCKEVEKKIASVAKQMIGSEMIYDVVEEAKTLLQKFNQSTSFHAEMLQRQEEQATVSSRVCVASTKFSFRNNPICWLKMLKNCLIWRRRRSWKKWPRWSD
jgi:hypothetical protein